MTHPVQPEQEETLLSTVEIITAIAEAEPVGLEWLQAIAALTEKYLGSQSFSVEFLAAQLYLSSRQLQRRFRHLTGYTVNQYIQEARLQRGRKMLESGRYLLKQVAAEVGFRDARYFAKLYRKRFGVKAYDRGESGSPPRSPDFPGFVRIPPH